MMLSIIQHSSNQPLHVKQQDATLETQDKNNITDDVTKIFCFKKLKNITVEAAQQSRH